MERSTVFRSALHLLGEADYIDGTPTARACEEAYAIVLRDACARYDWTFARRRAQLTGGREDIQGRIFQLPVDFFKLLSARDQQGKKIDGVQLYYDGLYAPVRYDKLCIDYQSDLTANVGVLPSANPLFAQGVIALLAAQICVQLTSNVNLFNSLTQRADKYLWDAATNDRQQDKKKTNMGVQTY